MKRNKVMMLSAALIIAGAAALFANGAAEVNDGTWQPGMGRSGQTTRGGNRSAAQPAYGRGAQTNSQGNNVPGSRFELYTEGEAVTLEGELTEIDGQLMFTAGDKVMTISAPGYPRSGFTPEAGTKLTVEGEVFDSLETCPVENDGHLIITAAEVDGQRYDFDSTTVAGAGRGAGQGAGAGRVASTGGRNSAGAKGRSSGRGRAW